MLVAVFCIDTVTVYNLQEKKGKGVSKTFMTTIEDSSSLHSRVWSFNSVRRHQQTDVQVAQCVVSGSRIVVCKSLVGHCRVVDPVADDGELVTDKSRLVVLYEKAI